MNSSHDDTSPQPTPEQDEDNLIDDKSEVVQAFNQPATGQYDDPLDGDKEEERLEFDDLTGKDEQSPAA